MNYSLQQIAYTTTKKSLKKIILQNFQISWWKIKNTHHKTSKEEREKSNQNEAKKKKNIWKQRWNIQFRACDLRLLCRINFVKTNRYKTSSNKIKKVTVYYYLLLQQPATKNHTRKKIKNHIPSPPDKKKRRNNIFLRIGGVLVLSSLLFKFITLWFERKSIYFLSHFY